VTVKEQDDILDRMLALIERHRPTTGGLDLAHPYLHQVIAHRRQNLEVGPLRVAMQKLDRSHASRFNKVVKSDAIDLDDLGDLEIGAPRPSLVKPFVERQQRATAPIGLARYVERHAAWNVGHRLLHQLVIVDAGLSHLVRDQGAELRRGLESKDLNMGKPLCDLYSPGAIVGADVKYRVQGFLPSIVNPRRRERDLNQTETIWLPGLWATALGFAQSDNGGIPLDDKIVVETPIAAVANCT
jgi:hypothetical protein